MELKKINSESNAANGRGGLGGGGGLLGTDREIGTFLLVCHDHSIFQAEGLK